MRSRAGGSDGRSSARKKTPLLVPPRMYTAGMRSWVIDGPRDEQGHAEYIAKGIRHRTARLGICRSIRRKAMKASLGRKWPRSTNIGRSIRAPRAPTPHNPDGDTQGVE